MWEQVWEIDEQGFHLGQRPNLNPLLILNGVDIVLKWVHYAPFLQLSMLCNSVIVT